jgi:hypothetical protein
MGYVDRRFWLLAVAWCALAAAIVASIVAVRVPAWWLCGSSATAGAVAVRLWQVFRPQH